MSQELIRLVEARAKKENVSQFEIGDRVNVHCKILEGDKERIQVFNGDVIARSGSGVCETFTVRRIVAGQGVERKFPLHSPKIALIEVLRSSVVRRAKLYYLRDRVGKKTRLEELRVERNEAEAKVVKTKKRGKQMEDDEPELDDTDIMDEAPMPDEDEAPRRSAAVSIDADDFGDDDI